MSHGAKYKDRINRKIENRVHLNTLFGGDGGKGGVSIFAVNLTLDVVRRISDALLMDISESSRKRIEEKLAEESKKNRKDVHKLFEELKSVKNDGKRKYSKGRYYERCVVVYCIPDDRIDVIAI